MSFNVIHADIRCESFASYFAPPAVSYNASTPSKVANRLIHRQTQSGFASNDYYCCLNHTDYTWNDARNKVPSLASHFHMVCAGRYFSLETEVSRFLPANRRRLSSFVILEYAQSPTTVTNIVPLNTLTGSSWGEFLGIPHPWTMMRYCEPARYFVLGRYVLSSLWYDMTGNEPEGLDEYLWLELAHSSCTGFPSGSRCYICILHMSDHACNFYEILC